MRSLIPVCALLGLLGVTAGTQLTLLPYAYLSSDPLPVYHQSQNTRTGEHAYSYYGGPSAKEEAKGPDGVTRGSYSYVDAHGILQSVFYVADDNGFRVAATNLPTDNDLDEANLLLEGHSVVSLAARRKRSLPESEVPSTQQDQSSSSSSLISGQVASAELKKNEDDLGTAETSHVPLYGYYDTLLLSGLAPTAVSHQTRLQTHDERRVDSDPARMKLQQAEDKSTITQQRSEIIASTLPTATSHQSLVQIHKDPLRIDASLAVLEPNLPTLLSTPLAIPVVDFQQNRLLLHRRLGLERIDSKSGPATVKLDPVTLELPGSIVTGATIPLTTLHPISATATSRTNIVAQGISQIHPDSKSRVVTVEPTLYQPLVGVVPTLPIVRTVRQPGASIERTGPNVAPQSGVDQPGMVRQSPTQQGLLPGMELGMIDRSSSSESSQQGSTNLGSEEVRQ